MSDRPGFETWAARNEAQKSEELLADALAENMRMAATIYNKDVALEAYRMEVEQYRFVLESVEWITDSNGSFCPSCGCWQEFGHDSRCLINRVLTGRVGEEG